MSSEEMKKVLDKIEEDGLYGKAKEYFQEESNGVGACWAYREDLKDRMGYVAIGCHGFLGSYIKDHVTRDKKCVYVVTSLANVSRERGDYLPVDSNGVPFKGGFKESSESSRTPDPDITPLYREYYSDLMKAAFFKPLFQEYELIKKDPVVDLLVLKVTPENAYLAGIFFIASRAPWERGMNFYNPSNGGGFRYSPQSWYDLVKVGGLSIDKALPFLASVAIKNPGKTGNLGYLINNAPGGHCYMDGVPKVFHSIRKNISDILCRSYLYSRGLLGAGHPGWDSSRDNQSSAVLSWYSGTELRVILKDIYTEGGAKDASADIRGLFHASVYNRLNSYFRNSAQESFMRGAVVVGNTREEAVKTLGTLYDVLYNKGEI